MSKISNETRLVLSLASEKALQQKKHLETLIANKPNESIKGRIKGLEDYETLINEIVINLERK